MGFEQGDRLGGKVVMVIDDPHGIGAYDPCSFRPGRIADLILQDLSFFPHISQPLGDDDQGFDPDVHAGINRRKDLVPVQGYDGEVDGFPDVFNRRIAADAQNLLGIGVDGIDLAPVAMKLKAFQDVEGSRAGFPRYSEDGHGSGFEEEFHLVDGGHFGPLWFSVPESSGNR